MKHITFGLTGGICCGKSTVSKTMRAESIPMIDADLITRQLQEVGRLGWQLIKQAFGESYLLPNQELDRAKLGRLVFGDLTARQLLNQLMHPLIKVEIEEEIYKHQQAGQALVGLDAPLLIESGLAEEYRPLIVVSCPTEVQLSRLIVRNNLTQQEANDRIAAQMPTEEKVKMADYVIDTSCELEKSIAQTKEIIGKLRGLVE
jgi:dephospho-CoA kinase